MTENQNVYEILDSFESVFRARPAMLGTAIEVNGMFFLIDQIRFIRKYGRKIDFEKQSWQAFLIEKKLIKEGHNYLVESLLQNPMDFELLQKLRLEYYQWLDYD